MQILSQDDFEPIQTFIQVDTTGLLKVCVDDIANIPILCEKFNLAGVLVHYMDKDTNEIKVWDGTHPHTKEDKN